MALAAGWALTGMGGEEMDAVMARHPLYPVVAAILTLHTSKDIDSLSNKDMANAVGSIISDFPDLELPVVAAFTHGAMALRADAGQGILEAALAARMSLASQDETMPISPSPDSSEEETLGPKGIGTMRPATGEEESVKGYHPSRRSEVYEQAFQKIMSRYTAWSTLDDAARAALLESGRQIESGARQATAAAQEAYAQLAAATQQSTQDAMQQINGFFAEVRKMVGSIMTNEMLLASKTKQPFSGTGILQVFPFFHEQVASPQ
ncbi:MAG: hypothetical protein O3B22_16285 [Proteobacteria bacterium]|nr:hypothetical protein [Pseudomonadota bacterium]